MNKQQYIKLIVTATMIKLEGVCPEHINKKVLMDYLSKNKERLNYDIKWERKLEDSDYYLLFINGILEYPYDQSKWSLEIFLEINEYKDKLKIEEIIKISKSSMYFPLLIIGLLILLLIPYFKSIT